MEETTKRAPTLYVKVGGNPYFIIKLAVFSGAEFIERLVDASGEEATVAVVSTSSQAQKILEETKKTKIIMTPPRRGKEKEVAEGLKTRFPNRLKVASFFGGTHPGDFLIMLPMALHSIETW